VLVDIAAYPQWYPRRVGMSVVKALPGVVGSELRLRPLGGRSFCCRIESIEEPRSILVRYHGDFIRGTGRWMLEGDRTHTQVSYILDATAHGVLAAVLARLLDLGRVHSGQMRVVLRDLGAEIRRRAISATGGRRAATQTVSRP
jgi:ribosome-associated toxin RatA of RatAB toxin-antitoxin module